MAVVAGQDGCRSTVNGAKGLVANGSNPDNTGEGLNFFTSFDSNPLAIAGPSLVLFLDDGGAGSDEDHDDMGIRIAVVPEPGTMTVLGVGLIALGWVGTRRKKDVLFFRTEVEGVAESGGFCPNRRDHTR